jgi:hypothetical protein
MSSNIPQARELVKSVLRAGDISPWSRKQLRAALGMMTRDTPNKLAKPRRITITKAMKVKIFSMARKGVAHHDIANAVGLRNTGRVSEVLSGRR